MNTFPLQTNAYASNEVIYQDAACTIPAVIFDANGSPIVNSAIKADDRRQRPTFQSALSVVYTRHPSGYIETINQTLTSSTAAVTPVSTGTATLVAGSATVADARVTANTVVRLSYKTVGGTPGAAFVNSRSAGVNFVIHSTSGTDTSVIYYEVLAW